jgi:alkylhydroperoxidase family enzyme
MHLVRLLLVVEFALAAGGTAAAANGPRLPALPNAEAWGRLPGAPPTPQPLPAWARILAGPMPQTTARMLELDAMHRGGERLDARLRCLTRWAAADANGCEYSKAVAAADLRRARNVDADLADLVGHPERLPELERAAILFARRMMREAHVVTDGEVKHLIDLAGEERVVALVTLLAHASFQDRVFLALNIAPEPKDGVPPLVGVFVRPKAEHGSPPKTPPAAESVPLTATAGPEWLRLREGLDRQKERPGRIRVPSKAEVLKRIGKDHPSAWQVDIRWSRVCYAHQPELTEAWFDCAAAFRQESQIDRKFGNAIFWVVTQALQCYY